MKFSEWFEIYFDTYCKDSLAYNCQSEYSIIYKKHYRLLYDMELSEIKPLHIQQCMNTASEYSRSRQRKVYFLLHRVFEQAIFNDYAEINPVKKVKPPKKIKKNPQILEPEQIEQLFDTDNATSRMLQLEMWTGLRRGELLALEWKNINLEKGFINVCQTLVAVKGGQSIRNTTKANKDRIVPLCEQSLKLLHEIYTQDSPEGFLFRAKGSDEPLKLRSYHDRYNQYFREQQRKHPDLPYVTPHKLRHTYASYMLQSGADVETVRMLLGHSDISTTQIYVHSNYKQMKEAADKLNFS